MSNVTGIYRFFKDGVLISEQKNGLTSMGKTFAIKSLIGANTTFVNSIGYGIDSASNSLNSSSTIVQNKTLGFEVGKTPVVATSFEIQDGQEALVFAGEINDSAQYEIYEVGIFCSEIDQSIINLSGELLLDFDTFDNFSKYGTAATGTASSGFIAASARIGLNTYYLGKDQQSGDYIELITEPSSLQVLNTLSPSDFFKLAMVNTCQGEGASVNFKFYTSDSDYYEMKFVSDTASGYKIINLTKDSALKNNNADWSNINKIRISNKTTSSFVLLDGFKVDYGNDYLDTTFGLVSRAKLQNAIFKPANTPISIEYSLLINLNGGS